MEDSTEALVTRLKESKVAWETKSRAEGDNVGRLWAEKRARYDELLRLSNFSDTCDCDDDLSYELFFNVDGGDGDYVEFWESVFGENGVFQVANNRPLIEGFILGATNVWGTVVARL